MEYIIDGEYEVSEELLGTIKEATKLCLKYEDVANEDLEISITFVSNEEIREINNEYRGIDKVTDVLSFPQFECPEDIPDCGAAALGDVVISMNKAAEQAEEFGHSVMREVMYLYVHSIFHLLGHDHMEEDEKAVMREAEEWVMSQIGLER